MAFGGGVSVTYGKIAEILREQGVQVTVLSPWNGKLDYNDRIWSRSAGNRHITPSLRNIRVVRQAMVKADVVVYPDNTLAPYIRAECVRLRKRNIWLIHTDILKIAHTKIRQRLLRDAIVTATQCVYAWTSKLDRYTLTTSRSYQRLLSGHGMQMRGYIDQGFKTKIFEADDDPAVVQAMRQSWLQDFNPDAKILLYAGRVSKEKRIPLLFAARPEECMLVVAGNGDDCAAVRAQHDPAAGVRAILRTLTQDELRVMYKAADLVVSASNFETYGMVAHESILCGTPPVVQNAQGFVSQIKHEENGFLVDFDDSEATQADIRQALTHDFNLQVRKAHGSVDIIDLIVGNKLQRPRPVGMLPAAGLRLFQVVVTCVIYVAATTMQYATRYGFRANA
jgi:glycosyltransferase involved in cell wall biosynthesis